MTKDELLKLNCFYDNEYLQQYVDLVNSNINTEYQSGITECHHIIPKVYFKSKKLEVDNSNSNLVNLIYCDHVLAHCLLALSYKDTYLISASIDGVYGVLNSFNIYKTLEEFVKDFPEVKNILKCNHFVSDEQKKKLSKISSNSNWYNNGVKETFTIYKPIGDEWIPGRLPFSEKQKEKFRNNSLKCHWYNDGNKSVFAKECPPGFIPGRIVTDKLLASNKRNAQKRRKKIK